MSGARLVYKRYCKGSNSSQFSVLTKKSQPSPTPNNAQQQQQANPPFVRLILAFIMIMGYMNTYQKLGAVKLKLPVLLLALISCCRIQDFDEAYLPSEEERQVSVNRSNANTTNISNRRSLIPRRLIFTYKYNLINPFENDPLFDEKDPLTSNVQNTIDKYKQYWKSKDHADNHTVHDNEIVVSFLSNKDCIEVIQQAEPKLVKHFNEEGRGDFKAGICRITELYM